MNLFSPKVKKKNHHRFCSKYEVDLCLVSDSNMLLLYVVLEEYFKSEWLEWDIDLHIYWCCCEKMKRRSRYVKHFFNKSAMKANSCTASWDINKSMYMVVSCAATNSMTNQSCG